MNRAERRKQGKNAEKPKTYVLTEDQIEAMKRDAIRVATHRTFLMFLSIPVMVLHDKFGFGKQRLSKFMDYALMWHESVYDDEVGLKDLIKVVEEECGIRVLGGDL